jgi:hypothetical protein
MKRTRDVCLFAAVLVALAGGTAFAAETYTADLVGREEVPPVSTEGRGFFVGSLNDAETSFAFVMSYFGLEGTASAAHIHFGPRGVAAGVVAFLCGGGGKPACPANGQQFAGTVTAADVTGPAGQGISAGEFDEFVRGLRGGDMYVNVHSSLFPGGEVRGQLR